MPLLQSCEWWVMSRRTVDAERDEVLRSAIDAEFAEIRRTRPDPTIYWNFIFEERNRLLKEEGSLVTRQLSHGRPGKDDKVRSIWLSLAVLLLSVGVCAFLRIVRSPDGSESNLLPKPISPA